MTYISVEPHLLATCLSLIYCVAYSSTLKMEAILSSYTTRRRHGHRCDEKELGLQKLHNHRYTEVREGITVAPCQNS
jgi:hypothetical protein